MSERKRTCSSVRLSTLLSVGDRGLEVCHELRQVFEATPEPVDVADGHLQHTASAGRTQRAGEPHHQHTAEWLAGAQRRSYSDTARVGDGCQEPFPLHRRRSDGAAVRLDGEPLERNVRVLQRQSQPRSAPQLLPGVWCSSQQDRVHEMVDDPVAREMGHLFSSAAALTSSPTRRLSKHCRG